MTESNGESFQVQEYTLFLKSSGEGRLHDHAHIKFPSHKELAERFNIHPLEVFNDRVVVSATLEAISKLKKHFPEIEVVPKVEEYVLFIPLRSREQQEKRQSLTRPNWQELAQIFGFQVLRDRRSQATIAATQDSIRQLQEKFPSIQVTRSKTYTKLSFAF